MAKTNLKKIIEKREKRKKNKKKLMLKKFFFCGAKKAKRSNGRPVVDMTPIQDTNEKKYLFKILHCTF